MSGSRAPHPATVAQPRPLPLTAAAPRPPHPAIVAQPRRAPCAPPVRPPHPATVARSRAEGSAPTAQRSVAWGKKLELTPSATRTLSQEEEAIRSGAQSVLSDESAWKLSASELSVLVDARSAAEQGRIKGYKHYYETRIAEAAAGLNRSEAEAALAKIHNHFFHTVTVLGSGPTTASMYRELGTQRSVGVIYVKKHERRYYGESGWSHRGDDFGLPKSLGVDLLRQRDLQRSRRVTGSP